jgi:hypothetical protein
MKKTILLSLVLLAFFSCTKTTKQTTAETNSLNVKAVAQGIDQPLPNAKKEPYRFTINADEDNEVMTETGSKITIPKGSLVDANGKTVSGKVELEFEEFHDASDIILSGIPMNITTEDGEMGSFESAGMFNISATHEGNEVRIGNNKTVEVEMASFREEEDFNFYEFDKKELKWADKGAAGAPVVNEDKVLLEKSIAPEPTKPFKIKKATSSDLVFELAVDKKRNPEFSSFDNVMWKMAGGSKSNSELFANTIKNPELQCIDNANSIFRLTGRADDKAIDAKVQPVLFGKNWKKAQTAFRAKLTNYNAKVDEIKEQRRQADKMASVRRSMELANFGTYNFDRLYHLKKKKQFNALFFIPVLKKVFKKGWLIQGKEKIAIPYSRSGNYKFTYDPSATNTVITFDGDGNLYEFKGTDFNQITNSEISAEDEFTFRMRETGYKVTTEGDLKAYLATL